MKGLKFLVSCAAVGALAVTCAAASFAADDTYNAKAEYDKETGKVTISNIGAYKALVGDGDLTLLILNADVENITEETKSAIVQIDQASTFSEVTVGDLAEGTYYVRIGGADADTNNPKGFIEADFEVKSSSQESPYENPDRLLGDVDDSESVDISDAVAIISYAIDGESTLEENIDAFSAADVDESGNVDVSDAVVIISYAIDGDDSIIDEVKTIAERAEPCEDF